MFIFDGLSSEWLNITNGVPQGSVLGPLLQAVFNIQTQLSELKLLLNVDKTKVISFQKLKRLQRLLWIL